MKKICKNIILSMIVAILLGVLSHNLLLGVASFVIIILALAVMLLTKEKHVPIYRILIIIGSPIFYYSVNEVLNSHYPWFILLWPFILNILFYFSFILIFYILLGNLVRGCYAASVLSMLLGVVNYFVRCYKDAPFNVYDIFSVRTLFNVLNGGMELKTDWVLAVSLLGYIIYWIVLYRYASLEQVKHKRNMVLSIISVIYIVFLYILVFGVGILTILKVDTTIYHAAEKNGFIVQFIESYRVSRLTEPDGYSSNKVEQIMQNYGFTDEEDLSDLPTVIVIMNESYADLSYYGDVKTDIEVLPTYHGLTENTIKGYALSSVFGGNTANSEWEFLTGNTMLFVPSGAVPFQMYLSRTSQSLVNTLESYGYSSAAFHPYESTGWLRKQAWLNLGFDKCFFIEDYDTGNPENLLSNKVKDIANYKMMLDYMDSVDNTNPQFLFNVTIQNHTGGYYNAEQELGYKIHILSENVPKYDYVEGYLTLMHESDLALKWLIDELTQRNKKYVVMMFGDHQVGFGEGDKYLEELMGKSISDLTEEENQDLYTVPYLIWANYDIDEYTCEQRTSMNYLSNILLKTIGVKGTGWNHFLDYCSEDYPAINAKGFFDQEGKYESFSAFSSEKSEGILSEYRILQYNNMFSEEPSGTTFFERK